MEKYSCFLFVFAHLEKADRNLSFCWSCWGDQETFEWKSNWSWWICETVHLWKLNNFNYILDIDIVWKIGIIHQDTKYLFVWREPFSLLSTVPRIPQQFKRYIFWKFIPTLHVKSSNLLDLVLLCVQDLKKSGSGRCVILGTVTATVNGAELGGMIPPLAHVGALNRDEKLGFSRCSQSLDGWSSISLASLGRFQFSWIWEGDFFFVPCYHRR